MKKSLFKILPVLAAVLLATSCGKDDNDNAPASGRDGVHTVSTNAIPFTIRVNTGHSLKKVGYAEDPNPGKEGYYNITFSDDDVANQLKMVIKEGNTVLGEPTLQPDKETFSGVIDPPSSNTADLTAVITTGSGSPVSYSSTSLQALFENCAHTFLGTFKLDDITVDLTDQNAYLAISMSKCQHKLDIKSGDADPTECQLSNDGKVWVAVPSGAALTVGSFLSKTADNVEAGNIYTISRPHCVDLGIQGILWTDHNIGATNPEDWGDYYAWGEIVPYYADGHAYDKPCSNWRTIGNRTITGYNWETYSGFDGDNNGENFNKYKDDASSVTLSTDDDVAYQTDNNWSMPTTDDFKALKENCYWVWTSEYGDNDVSGFIVYKVKNGKGKKQVTYGEKYDWQEDYVDLINDYDLSDTHIFIPAAGCRDDQSLDDDGYIGNYWSSSLLIGYPDYAYLLYFYSDYVDPQDNDDRYYGFSVRAVRRSL